MSRPFGFGVRRQQAELCHLQFIWASKKLDYLIQLGESKAEMLKNEGFGEKNHQILCFYDDNALPLRCRIKRRPSVSVREPDEKDSRVYI